MILLQPTSAPEHDNDRLVTANNNTSYNRLSMVKNGTRYVYWCEPVDFIMVKASLAENGIRLLKVRKNPCESLKAVGDTAYYILPEFWIKRCTRQSSWYRVSKKRGKILLVSGVRLPEELEPFLTATVEESVFKPSRLPEPYELAVLVGTDCYQDNKPGKWEQVRFYEKILFKMFFTLTGFWKLHDRWDKHWLTHRANHANFLCKRFTTEIDGEKVAYSISENAGICSACMEIFNVISPDSRKLVRACPGSILTGCLKKEIYYDVRPIT